MRGRRGVPWGITRYSAPHCGGTVSDFDLYEFPAGYDGRKTYVSVQGHSKSVPIIYTYKGTDGRNHILPDYPGGTDAFFASANNFPYYMSPKLEYKSPIDGAIISSRRAHEDHMRKHNVIEVGNEKWPTRTEAAPMPRSGYDVKRALDAARSA